MKKFTFFVLRPAFFSVVMFCFTTGFTQDNDSNNKDGHFLTSELLIGKTLPSNSFFPKSNIQTAFFMGYGRNNIKNPNEWATWLCHPRTGIYLGVTDFGNTDKLGRSYTLMPYIEYNFSKWGFQKLNLTLGMGGTYLDAKYHPETNEFNRAISTDFAWAAKAFVYYDIFSGNKIDVIVGGGIAHISNGHARIPNKGLNSLLLSITSRVHFDPEKANNVDTFSGKTFDRTLQYYYSIRTGIGQQTFLETENYNTKKEVYVMSVSAGKVYNKVLKVGVGFTYRFYEHYYDYIKENETTGYIDHPYKNATSFNVFIGAELLLSHIGLEWHMGYNLHKPFYKEHWRLAKKAEPSWYYNIKKAFPGRLGLKLYALNTNKAPKHNFFVGATINSNLGQADFNELSIGYVHRFALQKRD